MFIKNSFNLSRLKAATKAWWGNDPFTQSAAVAYYTIFSFPALLILYFTLASFFMAELTLQQQVFGFIRQTFGENAGQLFKSVIQKSAPQQSGFGPIMIASLVLTFAALRLFLQLQKALNHVWQIEDQLLSGLKGILVRRLLSFAVMIAVLFTLSVSLLLTSSISAMTSWLIKNLPDYLVFMTHLLNIGLSFIIISTLFSIILKKLPDVILSWSVVFPGAFLAAALFMCGEYLLGIYFGIFKPASAYGVTGSVILLMIWVSYSCSVLILGAEYSKILYLAENDQ